MRKKLGALAIGLACVGCASAHDTWPGCDFHRPGMVARMASYPLVRSGESIAKLQTDGTSERQVKSIVEGLVTVGHKEIKKNGVFLVPGFACRRHPVESVALISDLGGS